MYMYFLKYYRHGKVVKIERFMEFEAMAKAQKTFFDDYNRHQTKLLKIKTSYSKVSRDAKA